MVERRIYTANVGGSNPSPSTLRQAQGKPMETATKILALTTVVFLLMSLIWNFLMPKLPHMPWDIDLGKVGVHLYFPLISSIMIATILTIFVFHFFK